MQKALAVTILSENQFATNKSTPIKDTQFERKPDAIKSVVFFVASISKSYSCQSAQRLAYREKQREG